MNRFASYTRSAAFNLTLSASMIEAILLIEKDDFGTILQCYGVGTLRALEHRGLIAWDDDPEHEGMKCRPHLTDAGETVVELLGLAGFKQDGDSDA